jgi:triphosphoribosyl-dephospho-CoA synthase
MTKNSHLVAQYAQLAMILEVCATPKPGNIDRDHNYPDTQFEHFLASAVSVYPVMKKASTDRKEIGRYIYSAVIESAKWQSGGNTHFGAFILLVPLVMAGGRIADKIDGTTSIFPELNRLTAELVKNTDANDAVALYRAFAMSGVKVKDVGDPDLKDPSSIEEIKTKGTSLYQLMEISSSYDMIAREWIAGYPLTFKCANSILEKYHTTNINDAVVWTFMEILADNPDTFIQTKSDNRIAQIVSGQAKQIVDKINNSGFENSREDIMKLDELFIKDRINPGSTADIIIAGLFVALLGGLRF